MSKLMKNSNTYSGSSIPQSLIDKIGSATLATDAQNLSDAYLELKENKASAGWELITSGTTVVNIPLDYDELYIEVPWQSQDYTYIFTFYSPLIKNPDTMVSKTYLLDGGYISNTDAGYCKVSLYYGNSESNVVEVALESLYYNGVNAKGSASFTVYGRERKIYY